MSIDLVYYAEFCERFDEWASSPSSLIDEALSEAHLRTPASVWGDLRRLGILYLAAHIIASTPGAQRSGSQSCNCGNMSDLMSTRYGKKRSHLARLVSAGAYVTGTDPVRRMVRGLEYGEC